MSFYDLTKDGVLRPEELFKYRLKRDISIPSKGGQKEFEPDGSWLQNKRVESFVQERISLLSEPRVEKLKSLVEGVWDEHKRLVNLKKPGKFWMHMGFTDERRNWLYPEEALYLMETNTLELYRKDRPMSIQEGYSHLLGRGMCLEEYQVFTHLRRLGYVVLRHEEERMFTDYERQINLDQYVDKKKRKEMLLKGKGKSNKKFSHSKLDNDSASQPVSVKNINGNKESNVTIEHNVDTELSHQNTPLNNLNDTDDMKGIEVNSKCPAKRMHGDTIQFDECNKRLKLNHENGEVSSHETDSSNSCSDETDSSFYNVSSWSSCFMKQSSNLEDEENRHTTSNHRTLSQTFLDSDSISLFPDISKTFATSSSSSILTPSKSLLPLEVEITSSDLDETVEQIKSTYQNKVIKTNNSAGELKEKHFSCLEHADKQLMIKAKSWSEYKCKKAEKKAQMSSSSIVEHLWKDSVTPLMRPSEVTSYNDVMNRLQIIQEADSDSLILSTTPPAAVPKVSFDVHLPDHSFKKTMPGVPDHRVCVSRCDGVPPGLNAVQFLTNKYNDGVPLHWAVVDSGEIAFYVFDNSKTVDMLCV